MQAKPTETTTNNLGLPGVINDRRERYMRDTVLAVMLQLIGETGASPTAQELFDAAWPQYSANVDLTKPGRGQDELIEKCHYVVHRFEEGRLPGLPTLDAAIAVYQKKAAARRAAGFRVDEKPSEPQIDPATGQPLPLLLTAAQFVAGFSPPAYLIDGILQRGYLYSLTARTGHGKTAIAMYIAQCIARGQAMHGCPVKGGTVLICAGENPDDIRARFLVLAQAYGFVPENIKIRFIAGVVNIAAELPRIRVEAALIDDLVLVIVDTAAAYFPGDETNSNSQQALMRACCGS